MWAIAKSRLSLHFTQVEWMIARNPIPDTRSVGRYHGQEDHNDNDDPSPKANGADRLFNYVPPQRRPVYNYLAPQRMPLYDYVAPPRGLAALGAGGTLAAAVSATTKTSGDREGNPDYRALSAAERAEALA